MRSTTLDHYTEARRCGWVPWPCTQCGRRTFITQGRKDLALEGYGFDRAHRPVFTPHRCPALARVSTWFWRHRTREFSKDVLVACGVLFLVWLLTWVVVAGAPPWWFW